MRYRWLATPGKVTFSRLSNRWILVVVLLAGLASLAVGAWGISAQAGLSPFVAIFVQMLFAIGALFVVVTASGLASGDRYDPAEIVFDATRGHIRVRDASGAEVEIPFERIRRFDVRVKRLPSASQGTGRISASPHHYFAVVETESTSFEVVQSGSRDDADRAIAAMSACVAGGSPGAPTTATALPGGLASTPAPRGAGTTLRWRNAAVRPLVLFVVAASCIGFVLSRFAALFAAESSDSGFFYAILGFMALVLAIIVVSNVRKLVRDLRLTYELSVGTAGLRYAEFPASAPDAPARKILTLAPGEIARVLFEHRIGEQPSAIRAVPHASTAESIAIDVVALSATERMMLAAWIRERSSAGLPATSA